LIGAIHRRGDSPVHHVRRWNLGLVGILGLLIALAAWQRQWHYSSLPVSPAVDGFAYPVQVDGFPAHDPEQLRFLAESWPPGTMLTVSDSAGRQYELALRLREGKTALALTGLSGLVFLLTALVFFAPRAARPGIAGFFWVSFLYGLSIMIGGEFFPRVDRLRVIALNLGQIACLSTLPVVFLRLALTFPKPSARFARWRRAFRAPWVAAVALTAWQAIAMLRHAAAPTRDHAAALAAAHLAADFFLVLLTFTGVAIFAVRSRRLELTRERQQVRCLLWGFTLGAAPYVFLRTLPQLFGLLPLWPAALDRVVELAIPFAFVMAVVRDRFLDIDVIVRRSLLYGVLASVVLVFYLAAGAIFGTRVGWPGGNWSLVLPLALGLVAGIAFSPLRRVLGHAIDRTFFKLAHDYDHVLEQLELELSITADRRALAVILAERLSDALAPRGLGVAVLDGDRPIVVGDLDTAAVEAFLGEAGGWPSRAVARERSTSLPAMESPSFGASPAIADIVLAQPLTGREGTLGCVLIGPRASGRRWIEQDVAFLNASGRIAVRRLERIALQQAVAAETLARERLAELDRMRTEFLALVAHDLRTPAAGVGWSARNLLDGVVGPLSPPQQEYLRAIAAGGDHLNRLVDNLLEISRLDRAAPPPAKEPFDADDVWAKAVGVLASLAHAKNVTIVIRGGDTAPRALGDAHKMIEVAVNLLDNAIKYTSPGTEVTVTLEGESGSTLVARVRDRGPGLGGQLWTSLCARFAQGTPSPHSARKGFGLGLHIAVTYLELMNGTLEAGDHPQGGAEFSCRLPLAVTEAASAPEGDGT
jgi:signal transduction histidine kinase